MQVDQRNRLVDFSLLFVALIWGSNFAITKGALSEVHPLVFNVLRIALSLVFMTLVMFLMEGVSFRNIFPTGDRPLKLVALGFVGNFVFQMFFILGVSNTTAGNAALFAATGPVWTAVTAWFSGNEKISNRVWLGISLTVAGAAIIAFFKNGGLSFGSETLLGDGLILLSAMAWGSYTALCRPFLQELSPNRLALTTFTPIYPLLIIVCIPYWPGMGEVMNYSGEIWLSILFSGVFSTGVAYLLWNSAIKNVGSSQTAIFGNVVPIIAIAVGFFYLGEVVQIEQIVGGVLILFGLMIARSARKTA